ncbi:NAD(P)-dependent dehydrogenase (short-subunit alcohol dehydrogenase family) [Gelidibacter algens]|jgi:NAD(P)-dependent dehydrogenase (short-subunit alcohol dehydrogenase family)|uniref:NAD(P)-dependent dehydrogenase (Short-subunit alcohol dehydrogenase family) n=1 Tax=Gelidibacter algens TaxID=49280 RepID=A0A1A7QS64_9FLAO|nr:SDR family oxidoreductase [Gelidibacter algens]OBX22865.1 oxidoreductase [Gelidibacter algens]RAJ27641.1 NAD(P)-dependent dehydrogenase (short-subunit alcohol dehydrogenase family) [Gelidibacter algens]
MKTIIIVGGSKGIGKAIAQKLLPTHHIINISRTEPEYTHDNLTHHTCDILEDDLPELDKADGLVYCPGSINLKPISRLSLDEFRADFEINVLGAVKSIQKYLDILKKGDKPSIVLFSTVAAKLGMPFHASVAASKSGVEGLVKSLGAEMATTLRINAIAPTVTDTDLASKLLRNEKMIENITERHPLKKFLKPEEVADMAEFLLSEKAASISGQVFELDCGIVTFKI